MNVDLFLELTFNEVANSQSNRDYDSLDAPDLSRYDRLADARDRRYER